MITGTEESVPFVITMIELRMKQLKPARIGAHALYEASLELHM
jgi:hypothetical protein